MADPPPVAVHDALASQQAQTDIAQARNFDQNAAGVQRQIDVLHKLLEVRIVAVEASGVARSTNLKELIFSRFDAMDKALQIQTSETSRRLDTLNHQMERMETQSQSFVRSDLNDKDWARLNGERHAEQERAASARVAMDVANDTARRNTALAIASGAIGLLAVAVSVLLHFIGSGTPVVRAVGGG